MLIFDRQGLIPAVIQDDTTDEVLMVAFMNEEAFERTRETGYTHFFSRSRNTIWRKGEQSGHVQEVRTIFVNCEENTLLIRVVQYGEAACHTGYRSCYYRHLLPDDTYETVAQRLFDPAIVYGTSHNENVSVQSIPLHVQEAYSVPLEAKMRQLYSIYLYLRDSDLSEVSNTSRLLQERSQSYLVSRLSDELQELAGVQNGEHVHTGQQADTILEGSQVEYWLMLLAATKNLSYDDFTPHNALLQGYEARYSISQAIEQQQRCLDMLAIEGVINEGGAMDDRSPTVEGLQLGFALIGWACAEARVSPLAPVEFDLEQMGRKGLVGKIA